MLAAATTVCAGCVIDPPTSLDGRNFNPAYRTNNPRAASHDLRKEDRAPERAKKIAFDA
jgi:hypothetical protein